MADLHAIAQSWIGTPFQHQGRLKGVGVDCIGLVIEAYREAGILAQLGLPAHWNYTGYGPQGDGRLTTVLRQYLKPCKSPYPCGAIGVFRFGTFPTHTALIFSTGGAGYTMIHAYNSHGKKRFCVQEHALRAWWDSRLISVYATEGCS